MTRESLEVRPDLRIPEDELVLQVSRASGPGGQKVNKTSSRVTLRWSVAASSALSERQRARLLARLRSRLTREGELVLHAQRSRSQASNREQARARLVELVRDALIERAPRRPTAPTRGSRERARAAKRRRSARKRERARVDPE
ncbi:MAG TPA: alternative ribosome rescue aminoacyl-tRNA hydrolase ArfB [Myxococcota bacterium]|jgi:ribosome-associated protein